MRDVRYRIPAPLHAPDGRRSPSIHDHANRTGTTAGVAPTRTRWPSPVARRGGRRGGRDGGAHRPGRRSAADAAGRPVESGGRGAATIEPEPTTAPAPSATTASHRHRSHPPTAARRGANRWIPSSRPSRRRSGSPAGQMRCRSETGLADSFFLGPTADESTPSRWLLPDPEVVPTLPPGQPDGRLQIRGAGRKSIGCFTHLTVDAARIDPSGSLPLTPPASRPAARAVSATSAPSPRSRRSSISPRSAVTGLSGPSPPSRRPPARPRA